MMLDGFFNPAECRYKPPMTYKERQAQFHKQEKEKNYPVGYKSAQRRIKKMFKLLNNTGATDGEKENCKRMIASTKKKFNL